MSEKELTVNEVAKVLNQTPELLKLVRERKVELDRLEAEEQVKKQTEAEAKREAFYSQVVGAVIQKIILVSDSDYEYSGETRIITDRGVIEFEGIIGAISLVSKPLQEKVNLKNE